MLPSKHYLVKSLSACLGCRDRKESFRFHGETETKRNEMAQKETKRKFFLETETKRNKTKRKREKIPKFQYLAYEGPHDHVFSLLKNQILRFNQFL